MTHHYGIIPNGMKNGRETYMIDWCTETEDGIYRVPTGRFEENTDGIFHLLSNGLNMSLSDAVFVAKAKAKEQYPIYLYERMDVCPDSDNYWRFLQVEQIQYRKLYNKETKETVSEFDLMKQYLKILTEDKEITRKEINEDIGFFFEKSLTVLRQTDYIEDRWG